MATPVPIGTVWLYTLRYTIAGQTALTTQVLQSQNVTPIADYAAYASAALINISAVGNFVDLVKSACANTTTLVYHTLQPVYPLRLAPVVQAIGVVGSATGTGLPPNTAAALTKRSVHATRWGTSTMHLPVGTILHTGVDGKWVAGFLTVLASICNFAEGAWYVDTSFEPLLPVLWNKVLPTRVTQVTSFSPQATIRVERRRTVGLGI